MADAAFWNKLAERYASMPVKNPDAFERKIEVTKSRMNARSVVLDVGCGTGSLALRLAPFAGHVHGLDLASEMVRIAKGKALAQKVTNVSFHTGPFDDGFGRFEDASLDGVCAFSVLHTRVLHAWFGGAGFNLTACGPIAAGLLSHLRPLRDRRMPDSPDYTPPRIWSWKKENGGRFANINRPLAGATHDRELPAGRHPLQLYSLATPNGVKVTVMLEELLALDKRGAEYDAWLIRINEGEQFGSGFVAVNPNSKIPALLDRSGPAPVRVFESGAILLYLAEKFGAFLPVGGRQRAECLSWLFWQMGSAPFLGGGFGHFYAYAPSKIEYAIDRYAMEVKRQLDVLDRRLAESAYLAGDEYSIADMAVWPWYGTLVKGQLYEAGEFLQVHEYTNVLRWTDRIAQRPAVKRGRMVNRTWGQPASQLHERHDASDFDTRTEDKRAQAR
jgi:GST-like protein